MDKTALINELKEKGYRWEYDQNRYMVWYKDEFVTGAGVKLPREKPLHWRYARQNMADNLEQCIMACENHIRVNNL
jgi:hypothetical protein